MITAPQTRFSDVIRDINARLQGAYADPTTWEMRSLKRECEKVRDADPSDGWGLLGSYYALVGNADECDRCFAASFRLSKTPVTCGNYHANLGNLGYFSKAHQFFVDVGSPKLGMLSMFIEQAPCLGSFRTTVSYAEEAEAMGITSLPPLSEAYVRATGVLKRAGVTDEQVAQHLDAAGEILRRHRLFYGDKIRVNVSDVEGLFVGVTCIVPVAKTPKEVFELNVELAVAEQEMGVQKHPVFDVMFKPI
jgi:hypothetical protein